MNIQLFSVSSLVDAIRGKRANGTQYDLASEDAIAGLNALLSQIDTHLDNIKIEAESVNLNTDELEQKVDAVKTSVDALRGTSPDQKTLHDLHVALLAVETAVQALDLNVTFPDDFPLPTSQVATLTPQTDALTDAELRAAPVPVNTGLTQPTTPTDTQPVSGTVDVGNHPAEMPLPAAQVTDLKTVTVANPTADPETGLAKQGTLVSILAQLDDATADTVLSVLKALNTKDFATEAKLEAVRALIASLDGKDYATQTTLAALLTELQGKLEAGQSVDVGNFPAAFPLTAAQVATLTPQTNAMTDAEFAARFPLPADVRPRIPANPKRKTKIVSSSGNTTIIPAPGVGKRIIISYVSFTPKADPAMVTLRFIGGTPDDDIFLGAAAGKTWEWEGPENVGVEANLDSAQTYGFTLLYEEETI